MAQPTPGARPETATDHLRGLDAAVQALATRVSESVVQLIVTGFGPLQEPEAGAADLVIGPQRNIGSGGGPLVNLAGEMVGVNTFILTKSGGSQGLGFAIPSAVVASAYPQLRKYGHLHRGVLGVGLQALTPTLAASLRLSRASGVLVSDVLPGGGAETAGVHIGDIITAVNGRLVDNIPMLSLELGLADEGRPVALGLLRGTTPLTLQVPVAFADNPLDDAARLGDPESHGVPVLGIVGLDVNEVPALRAGLRIDTGVLVTARTQANAGNLAPLNVGDVIHAVDGIPVRSLEGLRVLLDGHPPNSDVVLQVERQGQLLFVACEIN